MKYVIGIDPHTKRAIVFDMKSKKKKKHRVARYSVGIDEVGRGSIAGPVVVCAARVPRSISHIAKRISLPLRDSKKLTANQREKWFAHLTAHPKIRFALARVYPKTIDRINISRAANLAAKRAYERLMASAKGGSASGGNGPLRRSASEASKWLMARHEVYLDGGLYIRNKKASLAIGAKTVIRGDEKIPAIAIASIIAKVTRDRLMVRLAKKHPHYGFEVHKGYGTFRHKRAIKKHGPSKVHRLTFLDFLKNSKPKRRNFSRKS